jgi:dihydropyrimidine dehydrogenase (NADP+)
MCDELAAFMEQHQFRTLADFKGHSLQYFTTHHDLVRRQAEARSARATGVKTDQEWRGDDFVRQSDALARG